MLTRRNILRFLGLAPAALPLAAVAAPVADLPPVSASAAPGTVRHIQVVVQQPDAEHLKALVAEAVNRVNAEVYAAHRRRLQNEWRTR
jgi:hypothetical protein